MLAARKVIRSEIGGPIRAPILLEGGGGEPSSRRMVVIIGAPLSDPITF